MRLRIPHRLRLRRKKAKKPVQQFRSQLVRPASRQKLINVLTKKLKKPSFFASLPSVNKWTERIRIFKFKGKKVIIKDTSIGTGSGEEIHGHNFEEIVSGFRAYHRALSERIIKAEHHLLMIPKVYARIGKYLVMEEVSGKQVLGSDEALGYDKAWEEIVQNFFILKKENMIKDIPQVFDSIVVKKGNKIIFFLPYDYC